MPEKRIVIAGGGLAGLITSLHLAKEGFGSTVIERHRYPFHRVCGEYVSNEVLPYLHRLGIEPESLGPAQINRLQLTSTRGDTAELVLDLGGFGISRYLLDEFLYTYAQSLGVQFLLETEVSAAHWQNDRFMIETSAGEMEADLFVGAHGKRSRIDKQLGRDFILRSSPYVGVKYHIQLADYPPNLIALHNFTNGYCGISRVEGNTVNLCYLTHRENVRSHGSLQAMEEAVLFRNPYLRQIFGRATFLFEKPLTINEISFETKEPVKDHILFCGDAAGMITPLCGNGMAMAIHSGKLLGEHIARYCRDSNYARADLETDYAQSWRLQFARRLWAGRAIQNLFGSDSASRAAVRLARWVKPIARYLVSLTHGKSF